MKPVVTIIAVIFSLLLIWRVTLPSRHRAQIDKLESQIRSVPEYGSEAQLEASITHVEELGRQITSQSRSFTKKRETLNISLTIAGIALAWTGLPLVLRHKRQSDAGS